MSERQAGSAWWTKIYVFVVEPVILVAGLALVLALLSSLRAGPGPARLASAVFFVTSVMGLMVLARLYGRCLRWRRRHMPLPRFPATLRIPIARATSWEVLVMGMSIVLPLLIVVLPPLIRDVGQTDPVVVVIALGGVILAVALTWAIVRTLVRRLRGLDPPADLVADAHGLTREGPQRVFVPWQAIRAVEHAKFRIWNSHLHILALKVDDPYRYGLDASRFQRLMLRGTTDERDMNVGLINLSGYMPSPSDSVRALRDYWASARP
ncbi:Uncharacterised protein [Bordetella ansorpii]|uniref:Uncharacterized protein n=1 Tax=Bordetella ansorpii TaxID=288768 RepID=A0A157SIJ6_9BORD|nr:hypothetical protein [Bordetella ansorpii]SAI70071.1 Uncharacterised protein [Bordetella ansorpii]